jgi:GNAT superfamily N-acetyltransferase
VETDHPLRIRVTTPEDPDFLELANELDAMLSVLNGEEDAFYRGHNTPDALVAVLVAERQGVPVGCGALKRITVTEYEVKRMYVRPRDRGNGVGGALLRALEDWVMARGGFTARLETSIRLEPAVSLYERAGYRRIPNYPPYTDRPDSICLRKSLRPEA